METANSQDQVLTRAAQVIQSASALLIGASNGLSIAEGYNIFADNALFQEQFGEFRTQYGFRSVLQGCFFEYPDPQERRRFFERLVQLWITDYTPGPVMRALRSLVGNRDYFIETSNADRHLQKAGFAEDKVFEIEGNFATMMDQTRTENRTMELGRFINRYSDKNLVFLELGIGSGNQLIKEPLMRLCATLPNSFYLSFNLPEEIFLPRYIADRSLAVTGDLARTLQALNTLCSD